MPEISPPDLIMGVSTMQFCSESTAPPTPYHPTVPLPPQPPRHTTPTHHPTICHPYVRGRWLLVAVGGCCCWCRCWWFWCWWWRLWCWGCWGWCFVIMLVALLLLVSVLLLLMFPGIASTTRYSDQYCALTCLNQQGCLISVRCGTVRSSYQPHHHPSPLQSNKHEQHCESTCKKKYTVAMANRMCQPYPIP